MLNGIDVSNYQPADITKLVQYDFVLIKATEGLSYVSPACDAQYQAARALGKLVGVYHFADGNDPVAEANHFVASIKGYLGQAILVLDDEAAAAAKGDAWSDAFVRQVKAASGGFGEVVYASASVLKGLVNTAHDALTGWDADWGSNPTEGYNAPAQVASVGPWSSPRLRQYTSNGTLPGYSGRLDLDAFYGTAADWQALCVQGASAPAPVVVAAAPSGTLASNQSSWNWAEIQAAINRKGYPAKLAIDNTNGPLTTAGVKWAQEQGHLTVDLIVGANTAAWLFAGIPAFPLPSPDYFGPEGGPAVSISGYHSYAAQLAEWQAAAIASGHNLGPTGADGKYGPVGAKTPQGFTAQVAHDLQAKYHLTEDSLIGPATWPLAWLG